MNTVTFQKQTLTVIAPMTITPLLASEGLVEQAGVTGAKGGHYLFQRYADGTKKLVGISGKITTRYEHPARN